MQMQQMQAEFIFGIALRVHYLYGVVDCQSHLYTVSLKKLCSVM